MDQQSLIELVSSKMKLIRVERGYTQDRMATILGVSKKTLVQIEKGRTEANWTVVVAVCALFRNSDLIKNLLGGDVLEVVETVAHLYIDEPKEKTMGGKIWWKNMAEEGDYILQQNVVSQHFRIISNDNYRWYSTIDKDEAENKLQELVSSNNG